MEWLASVGPFLVGAIFSAGGVFVILRITQRDVNGLGRKFGRSIACQVRTLAEEIPDATLKAKFMHLADSIDPK